LLPQLLHPDLPPLPRLRRRRRRRRTLMRTWASVFSTKCIPWLNTIDACGIKSDGQGSINTGVILAHVCCWNRKLVEPMENLRAASGKARERGVGVRGKEGRN
jgi:hypothetical protein